MYKVNAQPHRWVSNNPSPQFAQLLMVKLANAKITGGCTTISNSHFQPTHLWFYDPASTAYLPLPVSFKPWLIKPQSLDHKQTNLFLLNSDSSDVKLLCHATSPLTTYMGPGRHPELSSILVPAASTVLLGTWTEKSLSHLEEGPGPQDSQAKNVTLAASNFWNCTQFFPRKGSNKKRNLRIVYPVLVLNRERNSEISVLHIHQLCNLPR